MSLTSPFQILFTADRIPMAFPTGTTYDAAVAIALTIPDLPVVLVRDEGRGATVLGEVRDGAFVEA